MATMILWSLLQSKIRPSTPSFLVAHCNGSWRFDSHPQFKLGRPGVRSSASVLPRVREPAQGAMSLRPKRDLPLFMEEGSVGTERSDKTTASFPGIRDSLPPFPGKQMWKTFWKSWNITFVIFYLFWRIVREDESPEKGSRWPRQWVLLSGPAIGLVVGLDNRSCRWTWQSVLSLDGGDDVDGRDMVLT